jgi:hypothetical protein
VPVIGASNKIRAGTHWKRDCRMQSFFDMGKGEYQIMTNLTKYEMETVVNYNAGEQTATVYTRDKSVMRRLDRLVADYPDSYKLTGPKAAVIYGKPV